MTYPSRARHGIFFIAAGIGLLSYFVVLVLNTKRVELEWWVGAAAVTLLGITLCVTARRKVDA
jgi:hypothetical protein